MQAEPCACGCAMVASISNAEDCTCGCACCAEKPATDEEELAQLETLRHAIDARIGQLRPLVTH
jgi:uncharacterized protein YfcZ (UPF0381/DUF406 family)